ncbi:hypothetical protein C4J81_05695 [Deltaproteobacteria bacterium Smac51]|nr:hypothetical protein C4J81_05695 [Deltaproteobacteria bacterium Smac51]
MPVEIREICISLTLAAEEGTVSRSGGKTPAARKSLPDDERRRLIDDCARAVMIMLKDRKEA